MNKRIWMPILAMVLFAGLPSKGVWAYSSGITTASFGSGGCNECHGLGTIPDVTLSGPTSVAPGSTNTYTLTISNPGSQTHAGLNVSATGGTFAVGGSDSSQTQLRSGQITHTEAKMKTGGETKFSFNWTAPAVFTSITMRGWGNAVDTLNGNQGDKAKLASLVVTDSTVPTATPTLTATPSPTPPGPICASTPRVCATPAKSSLAIVDSATNTKDSVVFKWSGGPTTNKADYGDPTTDTHYALCIYEGNNLFMELDAPAADSCNGKPCWAASTKGFKYKDKLASPHGITGIGLAAGEVAGKAKIQLKAKGDSVPDPGSVPVDVVVSAQVVNTGNGNCWGDSWEPSEISNDGIKFKAKSAN